MSGDDTLTAATVENSMVSAVVLGISQTRSAHAAHALSEPAQSQPAGSDPCSRKRDDSEPKQVVSDTRERFLHVTAKL